MSRRRAFFFKKTHLKRKQTKTRPKTSKQALSGLSRHRGLPSQPMMLGEPHGAALSRKQENDLERSNYEEPTERINNAGAVGLETSGATASEFRPGEILHPDTLRPVVLPDGTYGPAGISTETKPGTQRCVLHCRE